MDRAGGWACTGPHLRTSTVAAVHKRKNSRLPRPGKYLYMSEGEEKEGDGSQPPTLTVLPDPPDQGLGRRLVTDKCEFWRASSVQQACKTLGDAKDKEKKLQGRQDAHQRLCHVSGVSTRTRLRILPRANNAVNHQNKSAALLTFSCVIGSAAAFMVV